MRSKQGDSRSGLCCSWAGCRRRNISSKLTPIIVQVFIVVVVWVIIKKTYTTSPNQPGDDVTLRRIKSTNDQGFSVLCNNGDCVKASSLPIKDIVSVSSSFEPGDKQKRVFLQVDVLTRNAEDGLLTLYPEGTPVVVDGILADEDYHIFGEDEEKETEESNGLSNAEKDEMYYDNSVEERDLGDYSEDSTKDRWPDSSTQIEISDVPFGKEKFDMPANNQMESKEENMVRNTDFEPAAMGSKGQLSQQMNFNDKLQNVNQLPMQRILPSILPRQPSEVIQNQQNQFPQNQMGQVQNVQQQNQFNRPLPINEFSNIIPRQNLNDNTGQERDQNDFIPQKGLNLGSGQHLLQNIAGKVSSGMQTQQNGMSGTGEVVNMQAMDSRDKYPPIESRDMSGMPQVQVRTGSDESTYAEGYTERLMRFKTEYYGRPVDDASEKRIPNYTMNNPNLCKQLDKIDVLFLINTIPQSDEQRQQIRKTFVDASLFYPRVIAHVFLVGLTSSPNFQGNLDKDREEFNDIVQGDFTDKSETRTLKGLMGFRWVATYCSNAQFVMKIDEAVFVDTDKLLQGLLPAAIDVIGKKAMLCFLVQNAPIPRSGPNAFDLNTFPRTSKIRPYCQGFAVLMTYGTISSLVAASDLVPVFQFDEFYLYGVLPFVAGGIEVYDVGNKRAFHDFGMAVVNCYKDVQDRCTYVATKAFSSRFTSLWEFVAARKRPGASGYSADPSIWNVASFKSSFYS